MALRTYTDPRGTEWKVWDIPPRFTPLRSPSDRRTVKSIGRPTVERRRGEERRVTEAPPEWIHGWICFQSDREKLRLCPLPEKWEQASSQELEGYRRRAVPAPTRHAR
jgi:hypothetical protein